MQTNMNQQLWPRSWARSDCSARAQSRSYAMLRANSGGWTRHNWMWISWAWTKSVGCKASGCRAGSGVAMVSRSQPHS